MNDAQTTADLNEALDERQQLLARLVREENRVLRESLDVLDNYVDPLDAFRVNGEVWDPLSVGDSSTAARQGFRNESELAAARDACRALAMTNEFAINGHENRVSYIVGSGHRYKAVARSNAGPADSLISTAQEVVDEFLRENRWHQRQQELVRRRDRDGEAFLRFFLDPAGRTKVRFVEPWQVAAPPQAGRSADAFGIRSEPDDVEQVTGFWIDGELIDAGQIQHRKANVDANVKRGVPLFYPVRKNLSRAEKLLRNMAAVSDIQTAIALIRKHRTGTQSTLEQFRSSLAAARVTSSSGATTHLQPFQPGTILDVHSDAEYDFPARGLDASRYVEVLQAILRAVASRLVMPEFMLTSETKAPD